MMKFTERLCILWLTFLITFAGGDIPLQVTGRVGETVTLTSHLNLTHPINRITWMVHDSGQKIHLADFINQKFIRVNKNYFLNRLEGSNSGTSLQIRELKMEDSGVFTAQFLVDGEIIDISYILTVFEPVPSPEIKMEKVWITPDWCNFTLHCSAPTKSSALSYSWMYRHKERYQLYTNGTTIHVSLQPESWDGEYLCFIHNPADQKNVSITAQTICNDTSLTKGIKVPRKHVSWIILPLVLLLLSLAWYVRAMKKKKKGQPSTVIAPHDEVQYIEIHTCQQDRNLQTVYCLEQKPASPREARTQTIYSELQNAHRTSQE